MNLRSWRRARARRKRELARHADPTRDGMYRLLVLDDFPWLTYTGTRAWCSTEPYWEDGRCQCSHMDTENE